MKALKIFALGFVASIGIVFYFVATWLQSIGF